MILWRVAVVLLASLLLACQRVDLDRGDLVGIWKLSDRSVTLVPPAGSSEDPRLELKSDGTFRAVALPTVIFSMLKGVDTTPGLGGSGMWNLDRLSGDTRVSLHLRSVEGVGEVSVATQLFVSLTWEPLKLLYYLDDPDSGRRLEFERSP